METKTVIATRAEDNDIEDDSSEDDLEQATSVHPPEQVRDEAYEVRRSLPRNGDSFIGSLDILTIHQMMQDQLPDMDSEAT